MTSRIEWEDWPPSEQEVERQFAKLPPSYVPLEVPEDDIPAVLEVQSEQA